MLTLPRNKLTGGRRPINQSILAIDPADSFLPRPPRPPHLIILSSSLPGPVCRTSTASSLPHPRLPRSQSFSLWERSFVDSYRPSFVRERSRSCDLSPSISTSTIDVDILLVRQGLAKQGSTTWRRFGLLAKTNSTGIVVHRSGCAPDLFPHANESARAI